MIDVLSTVIIGFLLGFIVIREHMTYKEMQKLIDKIISKDLNEYTACQVDIEQAKVKKSEKTGVNTMMKI